MNIPFNKPPAAGRELEYMADALHRRHLSGDGHYAAKCQPLLSGLVGGSMARRTHSRAAALEMAAILCGIEPDGEVIMPSFSFVSTANAFALRGGVPVFVDIRPETPNIDETQLESALTPRTKAIVVVHYAGVCLSAN